MEILRKFREGVQWKTLMIYLSVNLFAFILGALYFDDLHVIYYGMSMVLVLILFTFINIFLDLIDKL